MFPLNAIRKWLLQLELRYLRNASIFDQMPRLRWLNRKITADIAIIYADSNRGIRFRSDFRTPYLRLPVAVEKSQIGRGTGNGLLQTASFRFFDWQSWGHIDGEIEWHGEMVATIRGKHEAFISGFSYAVREIPSEADNLGIRLAEGVEGRVRVLVGGELASFRFEPGYWMLESNQSGYKIVAIHDAELMILIVSLSEIGSGKQRLYLSAMHHLQQWILFKLAGKSKEQMLLGLLKYVRDWGPLAMEPLFRGLAEMLQRLGLEHQEHVIFEFYADNWGVYNNWHGRLLALKILEVLATDKAQSALHAIFDYVKNRSTEPEEFDLICRIIDKLSAKTEKRA